MSAETLVGFVGFALMGGSALAALLFLIAWRHRRRGFEAGASLLVLGLTLRAMVDRVLPALNVPMTARDVTANGLEILLWGLAAFTVNAALRQFLWFGSLRDGDHSRAPQILIGLTGLGLYICAAMGIATRILGLDVTAVAATSGFWPSSWAIPPNPHCPRFSPELRLACRALSKAATVSKSMASGARSWTRGGGR